MIKLRFKLFITNVQLLANRLNLLRKELRMIYLDMKMAALLRIEYFVKQGSWEPETALKIIKLLGRK